jgi:hypothetical protein
MDDPNIITNRTGTPGTVQGAKPAGAPHPEMPTDFFSLRLVLYPNGGAVELKKPEIVVGRHSGADLRLILPDVSRTHCRFVFTQGQWHVFDLESTNGLFVNGDQIREARLNQRDLVRIGSYVFEVDLGAAGINPGFPSQPTQTERGPSRPERKAS